jgi:hypothetical protein
MAGVTLRRPVKTGDQPETGGSPASGEVPVVKGTVGRWRGRLAACYKGRHAATEVLLMPRSEIAPLLRTLTLLAPLVLAACAGNKEIVPYVERPVEQIYTEALNHLDAKE